MKTIQVKFENGTLSGKIANVGLYRFDFILGSSSKTATKVLINIVPNESEYDENLMEVTGDSGKKDDKKKKGCGGEIAAISILTALIGLAGVAVISRKRKED